MVALEELNIVLARNRSLHGERLMLVGENVKRMLEKMKMYMIGSVSLWCSCAMNRGSEGVAIKSSNRLL